MSLLVHLRMRERLGALALLFVLLAVLTGVSLTQAGLLDEGADQIEDRVLPALRRSQELHRLLDEARGLETLQFLADTPAERAAGLVQLQRHRRLLEAQLAAAGRPGEDDEDRRLKALVQERLAAYWAAQDRVLAALAQPPEALPEAHTSAAAGAAAAGGVADAGAPATHADAADAQAPLSARPARQLLARDSQAAWTAVGQALRFWTQHQEQRLADLAGRSRSQAEWLRWGCGGLMALLAVAALTLLWRRAPRYAAAPTSTLPPSSLPVPSLPETLESIAMHSRLVALNAAVQAARSGPPTDADMAERAHLASEAEALARRCDEARRQLRLGRPRARSGADQPATRPGETA